MSKPFTDLYLGVYQNSLDAILLVGLDNDHLIDINNQACQIYGFERPEFLKLSFTDISKDYPQKKDEILNYIQRDGNYRFETVHSKKDGSDINLEVSVSLVQNGEESAILWICRDITARKLIIDKIRQDTLIDTLTKLPNRALFMDRLNQAMARQDRNKEHSFALVFLDIDDFKNINDSLGHPIGDQYLIEIGARLRKSLRKADTIARFGGDEFAVLLEPIRSKEEVMEICSRVFHVSKESVQIGDNLLTSSFSLGIVFCDSNYTDSENIIRDADIAMYKAKEKGGNQFVIFDKKMREGIKNQLGIKSKLREAIDNEDFVLHYQPIISFEDGSLYGLEALVRWRQKDGSLVYPNNFIPLAEKSGMIIKLGDLIFDAAIDQLNSWKAKFKKPLNLKISINISSKQLEYIRFSDRVLNAIKDSKIDTGSLSLEVTESALIQDVETSAFSLDRLKKQGVQISLDDFGTGYSSLYYLSELPINLIKIDRSFVQQIAKTSRLNLLRSMINMGHELGKQIVAEGIETKEQLTMLRSMGCDYGQGYYICKPADADTIFEYIIKGGFDIVKN